MGEVVGWIIWGILFIVAISCSIWVRRRVNMAYLASPSPALNTALLLWFLLGWSLYFSQMNKLHLIWLSLLVTPLSMLSSLIVHAFSFIMFRVRKTFPIDLTILFGIFYLILRWLTFY